MVAVMQVARMDGAAKPIIHIRERRDAFHPQIG
jgi:hypothetical protein